MEETPVIDENCYDGKTGEVTNSKSKVISQGPSLTFFKRMTRDKTWLHSYSIST